eukprot:365346-Chlamydomonas_euryale.AAC.7
MLKLPTPTPLLPPPMPTPMAKLPTPTPAPPLTPLPRDIMVSNMPVETDERSTPVASPVLSSGPRAAVVSEEYDDVLRGKLRSGDDAPERLPSIVIRSLGKSTLRRVPPQWLMSGSDGIGVRARAAVPAPPEAPQLSGVPERAVNECTLGCTPCKDRLPIWESCRWRRPKQKRRLMQLGAELVQRWQLLYRELGHAVALSLRSRSMGGGGLIEG